jgi:hypothetical protein
LENGEDNEWIKHIKDKHLLNHINGMSKYRKMQNTKYTKRNENILKVWSGGVTLALIGCFAGYLVKAVYFLVILDARIIKI